MDSASGRPKSIHCKQTTYQRFGGAWCRVCRIPSLKIQHATDGAGFPDCCWERRPGRMLRRFGCRFRGMWAWSHRQHRSLNDRRTLPPNHENDTSVSEHLECNADIDAVAAHNEKPASPERREGSCGSGLGAGWKSSEARRRTRTAKRRKFPGDPSLRSGLGAEGGRERDGRSLSSRFGARG